MSVLFWMDKNSLHNIMFHRRKKVRGFVRDEVQGINDRMLIFLLRPLKFCNVILSDCFSYKTSLPSIGQVCI